jgi:L-fucose mutarotase
MARGSRVLKGIDPLLSPDLLHTLRAMGHGDEIVIADANFPAATSAKRLIRLDGISATSLVQAILTVFPLDDFAADAAFRMAVTGDANTVPPVVCEFHELLRATGYAGAIAPLERFAFYERARDAFAIVATGETRLWGNLILKKGVVRPS